MKKTFAMEYRWFSGGFI